MSAAADPDIVAAVRDYLVASGESTTMSTIVDALRASESTMRGAADLIDTARAVHRQLAGAEPAAPPAPIE